MLTVPGRKVNRSLPLCLGHKWKPSSARLLDHRPLGFLHLLPSGEAHPGTRLCVCVTHAAQGKSKGCVSVSPVPSAGPWPTGGHGERGRVASRTYAGAGSGSQPEAPFPPRAGGSPVPPRVQTGGFRPVGQQQNLNSRRPRELGNLFLPLVTGRTEPEPEPRTGGVFDKLEENPWESVIGITHRLNYSSVS